MTRRGGDGGYATLAVLLMAGLLAALAASLLTVSRPALGLARIGTDEAAAEAMIDGGLEAVGYLLFAAKRDPAKLRSLMLRYRAGTVRATVTDEATRIDINASRPELLAGIYRSAGGRALSPDAFAARVVDWWDKDADTTPGGAEADAYREAELGYWAPDRRFRSVDELRLVLGLSAREFQRLAPYVTVYNKGGKIDALGAPIPVLLAIPQFRRSDIERLAAARRTREDDPDSQSLNALVQPYADFVRIEPSGVYRVRLEARLESGASVVAEAVIAGPPQEGGGVFSVVDWMRPSPRARPR